MIDFSLYEKYTSVLRVVLPNALRLSDDEIMRIAPLYFRDVLQQRIISLYPVETITNLTEKERDILYGCAPIPESWYKMPPLAFAGHPEYQPLSGEVFGVSTVWVIDSSTPKTLIDSLKKFKVIKKDL